MKTKTILMVILAIVLVSCTPASISTPIETSILTATISPTITSTSTLEPTPTATLDPTAPQGIPSKDDEGYYIEANGVKNRQIEIVNPVTGEKTKIWAFSMNAKEGIVALYDESNDFGWNDQIRLQNLVDPRVSGADVVPIMDYIQSDNPAVGKTFGSVFFITFVRSRAVNSKVYSYSLMDLTYKFTSFTGPSEWFIPQNGIQEDSVTIIRRVEDLPVEEGNGVIKFQDPIDYSNYFYIRIYSVNKKLVTEIASTTPLDKLSQKQLAYIVLLGPMSVILDEAPININNFYNVEPYADLAAQSTSPYFSFTSRPQRLP